MYETGPQTKTWHLSSFFYFFFLVWVDPYVQVIPNWYEILQDTQTQHILKTHHSNS